MNEELNQTELEEVAEIAPKEASIASEETYESEADNSSTLEVNGENTTADDDLKELKEEFPELRELESVTELKNPMRYAALRDLGLSPAEAYILTSRRRMGYDNRSHLTSGVPTAARSPHRGLSSRELLEMRSIFGDMSDAEIHNLYKKVTK